MTILSHEARNQKLPSVNWEILCLKGVRLRHMASVREYILTQMDSSASVASRYPRRPFTKRTIKVDYEQLTATNPQSSRLHHLYYFFFKLFEFKNGGFYPKKNLSRTI